MKPTSFVEQLLFSTVRLDVQTPEGLVHGTAFIFKVEYEGQPAPFLVTNKHVVKGGTAGQFFFTLSDGDNPIMGEKIDVEFKNFEQCWYPHPEEDVDVTVMPLAPVLNYANEKGKQLFYRWITNELIPSSEQWIEFDAMEEVIFVGYPVGLYDEKNLMPILRRGTTATSPQLDYNGMKAFLIDASVFPGSSGSPVLICNQGTYTTRKGITIGSRYFLLGIIAKNYSTQSISKVKPLLTPTTVEEKGVLIEEVIDLGIVYKSNTIMEAVDNAIHVRAKSK